LLANMPKNISLSSSWCSKHSVEKVRILHTNLPMGP
jgi:hypothetical protein